MSTVSRREPHVVFVVGKVIVQDEGPDRSIDTVKVVHEVGDIIIRYHDRLGYVLDIYGAVTISFPTAVFLRSDSCLVE